MAAPESDESLTSDTYTVAETPFFYQPEVADVILKLGKSSSIVVYAGAGVTIDRTGLGWAGLVNRLLMDRDLVSAGAMPQHLADRATRHFQPVEAATVLKSLHKRRFGEVNESLVIASLGKKLYATPAWLDSTLSKAVLEFLVTRAIGGARVSILTTNYETLLEDALEPILTLASKVPKVVIKVQGVKVKKENLGWKVPSANECEGSLTIEYLHGRIDKNGRHQGVVALDELDYFKIQAGTPKFIEAYLGDKEDLLILGSSLSDAPLLKALDATKDRAGLRVALFPVPAFGLVNKEFTSDIVLDLSELMRIRMYAYEVEVLVPDFFSQVAQFLRELTLCATSEYTSVSYREGLRGWWKKWGKWKADTAPVHGALVSALDEIRAELALPGHSPATVKEALKLEVWVRDLPHHQRRLALWASSAAVFGDAGARRSEPIRLNSAILAVRAFASGKPVTSFPDDTDSAGRISRWKSYLAIPIIADSGGRDMLLGAAVLASQSSSSRIDPDWATRMQGVIGAMNRVGEEMLALEAAPVPAKS